MRGSADRKGTSEDAGGRASAEPHYKTCTTAALISEWPVLKNAGLQVSVQQCRSRNQVRLADFPDDSRIAIPLPSIVGFMEQDAR